MRISSATPLQARKNVTGDPHLITVQQLHESRRAPLKVLGNVIDLLVERYQITPDELRGDSKRGELVYVRQLFCYWVRWYYATEVSLNAIAHLLNRSDHTTVIHACKAFSSRISANNKLPKKLRKISSGTKEDFFTVQQLIKIRCL